MRLPAFTPLCPALRTAMTPLVGVLVLCSGSPAQAKLPETSHPPPQAMAVGTTPIYALRTRFSGQSGVISFTTVRPRKQPGLPARDTVAEGPAPGLVQHRITSIQSPGLALSSGFGLRTHPILGTTREHRGIDLAAPAGSPILAPSPGVVSRAGWAGGYGIALFLEHGGGIETRYGHLARLNVVAGQTVRAGDVLGFVGSTGLSTGPHLHYEVRVNGHPVNPLMTARVPMRRQGTVRNTGRTAN